MGLHGLLQGHLYLLFLHLSITSVDHYLSLSAFGEFVIDCIRQVIHS
jgi:hypothetical protein